MNEFRVSGFVTEPPMQNSPKAPWRFRISERGDAAQFLITCWPSDIAGAHPGEVRSGDFVEVCGRLYQHKYVTFQGQQRERLELVAQKLEVVDSQDA